MIFYENRLLADDSHVISYLIFVENWERCLKIVVCCSRGWHFKGKIKIFMSYSSKRDSYFGPTLCQKIYNDDDKHPACPLTGSFVTRVPAEFWIN